MIKIRYNLNNQTEQQQNDNMFHAHNNRLGTWVLIIAAASKLGKINRK